MERLPTVRITDLEDHGPLLRAAARLCEYDWAVLTSVNGVERFAAALQERGIDVGACPGVRWAAIGPATARALHRIGVAVVLLPITDRRAFSLTRPHYYYPAQLRCDSAALEAAFVIQSKYSTEFR